MNTQTPQWQIIGDDAQLAEFLQRHQSAERCCIDLEADSLHRYGERICLIQVEVQGEIVLVDPLAEDFSAAPLYQWMTERIVWMHGADYDMRLLQYADAQLPQPLFDTQIAAQLIGRKRFGLAALIEEEFGMVLSKASQKADWAQRPLPEKMQIYAAYDVFFLDELAQRLVAELQQMGRYEWFLESCERARNLGLERSERDPEMVWRINGWGKLSRRGLAYLRALWYWREASAKEWDKPVFYLSNNQKLIDWASDLDEGINPDFSRVRSRWRKDLHQAVYDTRKLDAAELPVKRPGPRGPRRKPEWEKQFENLRELRNRNAEKLGIDPGVLVSRAVMEQIVTDPALASQLLLSWQAQIMGIGPNWRP